MIETLWKHKIQRATSQAEINRICILAEKVFSKEYHEKHFAPLILTGARERSLELKGLDNI